MDEDLCGQDHHEGHGILFLSLFFLLINMNVFESTCIYLD
jgi:hypothetical protein